MEGRRVAGQGEGEWPEGKREGDWPEGRRLSGKKDGGRVARGKESDRKEEKRVAGGRESGRKEGGKEKGVQRVITLKAVSPFPRLGTAYREIRDIFLILSFVDVEISAREGNELKTKPVKKKNFVGNKQHRTEHERRK